ncbi:SusC/RagA family TonB-linked outer membrane protein [Rufibacter sediminis]|uniref:TonB-dependent receptor n=1 Tax=Rufibacter sediminis TaxID=2762756 RepID=A0ABR6VVF2_9BACT|nr:TonB-dependent receptor [Rufibacter sediminis]MBC3540788.1 TonB-dependent receptor [Rufibacter sediminis]
MKRNLLIFLLLHLWGVALAQTTINGRVTSAKGGEGLPGVSVVVKGTTSGTTTDVDGRYQLQAPANAGTLVVSYIGFANQELPINGRTTINVTLQEDQQALEEIVVIGYGTQQKSLVTGAISSVKAAEIATVSSSRIEQALQGRTAGVTVLPASGSPGSGMRVRVRGTGSNQSSEPLYIVDGVRTGGIEYLDPSEIASIEVLKDAASAAIYGSEGANGVVIISTKTGKTNTSDISYGFQYGVQSVGKLMPMMNAQQYQQYQEEAKSTPRPTAAEAAAVGKGTDWFDEVFQSAPQQRHTINFSGGTENSTYLVGGSYFTQKGIVGDDKSKFDRYTVRINSDHKIKPWLNIGQRLSYSNFSRSSLAENDEFGGLITSALSLDPLTPVIYSGQLPAHAQAALEAGHPLARDENGNYYGISNFIRGEYGNPVARIALAHGNTVQNKLVGNIYADIEPLKGLKFTSRFGIDGAFQKQHAWTPTYWFSSESQNSIASGSDNQNNWYTWQWENFATYNKTIGQHNFTVLAGTSAIKSTSNFVGGSYSGLFREDDNFSYADGTPDDNDRIGSNTTISTLGSFYGRLAYNYAEKYLLNATFRRDGSSRFAQGNQWGNYPSVSLGWVVSNEDFFPDTNINHLKLRASWGQNGSTGNIRPGQWFAAITPSGKYLDANGNYLVGASPDIISNPNLKWETSEQVDFGLDLGMFNNRLTFTTDFYNKKTKDLITAGVAPGFAGNPAGDVNGGNVTNRGWEFELTYRSDAASTFQYEVSGNITTVKNEVTFLNPNVNEILGANIGTTWPGATVFDVGYPIWYLRGYKTDGILQNVEEVNLYKANITGGGYSPQPGDPRIVDLNGDKQISSADFTMIGNPHPDVIFGARVNLAYKGFDLLAFLQGQIGNDLIMGFNRTDRATANKPAFFFEDRWTGPGSTNSWFRANTNDGAVYSSDLMVFDGSYARVRQLQLGYTLPNTLTSRIKIKSARLYVSLDNYFTFTDYPGLDPEAGSNNANSLGIDRGTYPVPRLAMFGLNFNF